MPESLDQLRTAEERAAQRFWSVPGKFAVKDQDALDFLRFCIEEHRTAVRATAWAEMIATRQEPPEAIKTEAAALARERGWLHPARPQQELGL